MSDARPLHPEVGVIALVGHQWARYWQVPHQVLTRLSDYFHVVWVNPAHGWRETLGRGRDGLRRRSGPSDRPPGFHVYTPGLLLPEVHRPAWLGAVLGTGRIRRARRILAGRGCRRIVLYLWRPQFAPALFLVPHDASCYHIDDEFSFSPVEVPLEEGEERLIRSVDRVFISSPRMFEKKGRLNPHSTVCRNGVDYCAFAKEVPEPSNLATIPRPRIGYIGFIKKQLDWPLLLALAEGHREWNFVFVGKRSPHREIEEPLRRISALPNVTFLGAQSVQDLPAYPQHFDVCLMPYRIDDYTKYIDPLKLQEYLACGRPVVGSPIPAIEEFRRFVEVASTLREWEAAITSLLGPRGSDPESRAARQREARGHDWKLTVRRIADAIASSLRIEPGQGSGECAEESAASHGRGA